MKLFKQAFNHLGTSRASNEGNQPLSHRVRSVENTKPPIAKSPDITIEQFFKQTSNKQIPNYRKGQKKNNLTKQFFSLLSSMENKLLSTKSTDLVNKIVEMYQQCVEIYDALQDPIKYYFADKIQNILAEAQSWKIFNMNLQKLEKEHSIVSDESFKSQKSNEEFHDIEPERDNKIETVKSELQRKSCFAKLEDYQQEKQENIQQDQEDDDTQFQANKRARSRKLSIIQQLKVQNEQSFNQMNDLISNYQNQQLTTDRAVKDILAHQDQEIQNRIKRRSQSGTKRLQHFDSNNKLDAEIMRQLMQ